MSWTMLDVLNKIRTKPSLIPASIVLAYYKLLMELQK